MVLDYLDSTPNHRLRQICHTLKAIHGIDIQPQLNNTAKLAEMLSRNETEKNKLIEASSFNSYLHNPMYIKSMLIIEAVRIQINEIAPKRRKKNTIKEDQDTSMDNKEQQKLDFARKLEQFALHTQPPTKTGKLSNLDKQNQEQRDLFVVSLQTIADKLTHAGTSFAKPEETRLTPLERNILTLMRHAQSAGMLDGSNPTQANKVVDKGVEMFGDMLIAARQEIRSSPEIRSGDAEVDRDIEREKGLRETSSKVSSKTKKPDADGDGIPDWADKRPNKKDGKADRKLSEMDGAYDFTNGDEHEDISPVDHDIQSIGDAPGEVDVHHSDAHTDDVKHYEYQASMARSELYRNAKYAMSMLHQVKDDDEIQPWIAASLTKAATYLDKIYHYLDYYKTFEPEALPEEMDGDAELGETSGSVTRQNLMLIAEYSTKLFDMIKPGDHLEGWVAMKLTTASECISSSKHYLDYVQFEHHALDGHFDMGRSMARKEIAESRLSSFKGRNKRKKLRESQDLAKAETLLAAKDLSDQLQSTAEKVAKMAVEDLMPLVDVMRDQFGPEAAQGFNDVIKQALDTLLTTTSEAKETIDMSITTLQSGGIPGNEEPNTPPGPSVQGADELGDQSVPDTGEEDDGLGATPAASGEKTEPLGRSKKGELAESWGTKMNTAKKDVGKWEGWTQAELKARKAKLMKKETRSAAEQKEVKQIDFALRAKHGFKGKVSEATATVTQIGGPVRKPGDPLTGPEVTQVGGPVRTPGTPLTSPQTTQIGGPVRTPGAPLTSPQTTQISGPVRQSNPTTQQPSVTQVGGPVRAPGAPVTGPEVTQVGGPVRPELDERAPPGADAEAFIRKNKSEFLKRYGKKGMSILYATAWKKFGKKSESFNKATAQLAEVNSKIVKLTAKLNEHRASFRRKLSEGKVVDPLNVGYGLDGEVIQGRITACENLASKLGKIITREKVVGIKHVARQVKAVMEIRNLRSQKNHAPWGVVFKDKTGAKQQKFFESSNLRNYWYGLNKSEVKVLNQIDPAHFNAKITRLGKI